MMYLKKCSFVLVFMLIVAFALAGCANQTAGTPSQEKTLKQTEITFWTKMTAKSL